MTPLTCYKTDDFWIHITYIFVVVHPDWLVISDSFLFLSFHCFWCQFCTCIFQLAVFGFGDLVEIERETLAFLQTHVKTFFLDRKV